MTVIVVGFRESRSETPKVVYCGPSGSDAIAAAAAAKKAGKFRFFGRLVNPLYSCFSPPEPAATAVEPKK